MNKFISTIVFMGLGWTASAQPIIKVGPELGVNFATMSQKIQGDVRETNYQLGFRFGGTVDYQFKDEYSLQAGLILSAKNGSESYFEQSSYTGAGTPISYSDRRSYSVTYLQLPIYALYKTGKEYDDPHFFFGVGPYFGLAVGGRFQQEYSTTLNGVQRPQRYDYSIPIGNKGNLDKIRPFDFGANVTVGYESTFGLIFRAHYGLGFLNLTPEGDRNNRFRNQGGGLSVGFLFHTVRQSWK